MTKILFWRLPGAAGSTKILFWRPRKSVGFWGESHPAAQQPAEPDPKKCTVYTIFKLFRLLKPATLYTPEARGLGGFAF